MKQSEKIIEMMRTEYEAKGPKWKFASDEYILCPFHTDEARIPKTFLYLKDEARFYCSTCQQGGTISEFIKRVKQLDDLAVKQYLQQTYTYTERPKKKLAHPKVVKTVSDDEVLCLSQVIHRAHQNLKPGSTEHQFLLGQGISVQTINQEKLGYVGSNKDEIKELLHGIDKSELFHLGILHMANNGGGESSPFQNHILVPLYVSGKAVGLWGISIKTGKVTRPSKIHLPYLLGSKNELDGEVVCIVRELSDYLLLIENSIPGKLIGDLHQNESYQSLEKHKNVQIVSEHSLLEDSPATRMAKTILDVTHHTVDAVKILRLPQGKDLRALSSDSKISLQEVFAKLMKNALNLIDYEIQAGKSGQIREILEDLHHYVEISKQEAYLEKISRQFGVSMETLQSIHQKSLEKDKHSIFAGLTDTEPAELYPAQDYYEGQMYYSFMNDKTNQLYVFRTDRKYFHTYDGAPFGLRFRHHSLDKNMVKRHYIDDYLNGKVQDVNCLQLYNDILVYLQQYIYLADQRLFTLSAIWIMNTYLYRGFEAVPYLWLNGDKGTGKTRFRDVMSQICFNSLALDSTATAPVIFRNSELMQPTLFIDEFENMKHDMSSQLKAIFNTGYKKGSSTSRMHRESKDKEAKSKGYGTYCPKVFLGIDSDLEGTLQDRCIWIGTQKPKEGVTIAKFVPDAERERTDSIKMRLLHMGLLYAKPIIDLYRGDQVNMPPELTGREKELWEPLFCIANYIDQRHESDITQTLMELCRQSAAERKEMQAIHDDKACVVILLSRMITGLDKPSKKEGSMHWYPFAEIKHFVSSVSEYSLTLTDKALAQILQHKLCLEQEKVSNKRCYKFSRDILYELAQRMQIPIELLE